MLKKKSVAIINLSVLLASDVDLQDVSLQSTFNLPPSRTLPLCSHWSPRIHMQIIPGHAARNKREVEKKKKKFRLTSVPVWPRDTMMRNPFDPLFAWSGRCRLMQDLCWLPSGFQTDCVAFALLARPQVRRGLQKPRPVQTCEYTSCDGGRPCGRRWNVPSDYENLNPLESLKSVISFHYVLFF